MHASATARLLVTTFAISACKDQAGEPATLQIEETIFDAVGTEPPIVRVLEPGREPRASLERPSIARERRIEIVMGMASTGGGDVPDNLRIVSTWSAPAARSEVWRFDVQSAGLTMPGGNTKGAEAAVTKAIASLYEQSVGRARQLGPAHVEIAQTQGMSTSPSMSWLLHLFVFAPPADALGPGAEWTSETKFVQDGLSCADQRTYELVAIDASVITARLHAESHCDAPTGATDAIPTSRQTLNGELRFDPSDVLATSGEIASTLVVTFPPFADARDREPMTLETRMNVRLATIE